MRTTIFAMMLGAVVLAACSVKSPPVAIHGSPVALEALVGHWVGEYASGETGRSGSITFDLTAGGDSAFGDVIMIPRGFQEPLRPYRDGGPSEVRAGNTWPEMLTIEFVVAQGDRVTGRLSPYHDPECGCPVATTFEGRVRGDTIEGTFTTRHLTHDYIVTGEWKVARKSPS